MFEKVCDVLQRRRRALYFLWWAHVWIVHYLILGFISVDGLGYRGFPLVELLKHGSLGADRFNDWSLHGYVPFVELANLPFLAIFGLRGMLMGLPLVVFPLCVLAVFCCIRELTSSERAATLGALAYCAMPMVNQQPFSGYIDFAVTGLLAFFVYSLARLRSEPTSRRYALLAVSTVLFTLSRAQAFYMLLVLVPILGFALHSLGWRKLVVIGAVIAAGCLPSIGLQIYKWITFGSPIAPAQLEIFGMKIGTGAPMSSFWLYAGLEGSDLPSLLKSALHGWIFHPIWPLGGFYASGSMGAGLMFLIALVLLPRALREMSSFERWLLAAGVVVSILSKDFALPRYSYTTMLAITLVVGRGLSVARPALRMALLLVIGLHLLRPELDIFQLRSGYLGPRLNASGSPFYARGGNVFVYPGGGHSFVIIDDMPLPLPVFGRDLSNDVLATIPSSALGPRCEGLAAIVRESPEVLFIDEHDRTASCRRTCVIKQPVICGAWRIAPGL